MLSKKLVLKYVEYNSLEEMFLSFKHLADWTGYSGEYLDLYKQIYDKLQSGDDYFRMDDTLRPKCKAFSQKMGLIKRDKKKNKTIKPTREQFAKEFLHCITG